MNKHYSVLKEEAIQLLNVRKDGIYIDGTLGRAGHSKEILSHLDKGHLYAFDLDEKAIAESKEFLKNDPHLTIFHDNYASMNEYIKEKVDGILLDLGVSSPQFDSDERGFSYRYDGPLDMRMNIKQDLSAAKIINEYEYQDLVNIFAKYGETKYSRIIAQKIIQKRQQKRIETTYELVNLIKEALPAKELAKKGHPAKQIFQALRIEVNSELDSLAKALQIMPDMLNKNGRIVVISFHSLEDRMVKQKFRELSSIKIDPKIPLLPEDIPKADFKLLTPKAVRASQKELAENRRSHSALLRAIEKER